MAVRKLTAQEKRALLVPPKITGGAEARRARARAATSMVRTTAPTDFHRAVRGTR